MPIAICKWSTAIIASLLVAPGATQAAMNPADLIIPTIDYAPLDLNWLAQDDDRRVQDGLPLRFAVPHDAMITAANNGMWDRDENRTLRWRLRIDCNDAPHVNLGFEYWNMPESGELTITSTDGTTQIGPFTSLDNMFHGELWLPIIAAGDVILSITCDDKDRQAVENGVVLTKVNVGYRGFGAEKANGEGRSGSCNVDVVCPEGDPWQNEIACVGLYTINGFFTCSGGMLNNTNQDETPFFLTADHCGVGTSNDQTMVVYWNYKNSYCRTPGSGDSGGNGNGNYNQFTSGGAIFRAGSGNSDFTLVELNNDPNPNYNVGFCGWDRRTVTPQDGICIHHPNLDEMRISFENDSLSSQGSYWRVNDWDLGTTEPGSSGSLLFSQDHRVVGQLFGGLAACNNNDYDVYGKVSSSWNSGMGNWLDAAGTNEQYIETLGGGGGNGGVCCLQGGCFSSVDESTCGNAGGIWYTDENCGAVDCSDPEPQGACCLASGSCTGNVTSSDCANLGGDYQGDNTSCSNANCPQPEPTGACCFSSGNCSGDLTTAECSNAGGDYQGDSTSCDNVSCDSVEIVTFHHAIVGTGMLSGTQDNWTVDVYVEVEPGSRVDAVAGNSAQQKMITSTYGFYQDPSGGPTSGSINPNFYEFVPDLEWDSRVTIGALDQSGNQFGENNLQDVGIEWTQFENGNDLSVDDGTWFILPSEAQGEAQLFTAQDCSQQTGVLVARLTAMELDSTVMFEALIQGRDAGGNTWQDTASLTFNYSASEDCNGNLISDTCDIANGTSEDANQDGVPDECGESCPGDVDGDGDSDVDDILGVLSDFGSTGGGYDGDVDNDNDVDVDDILQVLSYFGGC